MTGDDLLPFPDDDAPAAAFNGRRLPPTWAHTHARTDDPDTSKAAAALVASPQVQVARLLLSFAVTPLGMTADQASAHAGLDWVGGRKRVSDLLNAGLIEDTGQRELGEHGRLVRVLRITDDGWTAYRHGANPYDPP